MDSCSSLSEDSYAEIHSEINSEMNSEMNSCSSLPYAEIRDLRDRDLRTSPTFLIWQVLRDQHAHLLYAAYHFAKESHPGARSARGSAGHDGVCSA